MTNLNRVNLRLRCDLVQGRRLPPLLSAASGSPARLPPAVSGGQRRVLRCPWLIASRSCEGSCSKRRAVASERQFRRFAPDKTRRCRSSVVEHSLGKGEVESPILSGSTIFPNISMCVGGKRYVYWQQPARFGGKMHAGTGKIRGVRSLGVQW
jgi:hypothetical protein